MRCCARTCRSTRGRPTRSRATVGSGRWSPGATASRRRTGAVAAAPQRRRVRGRDRGRRIVQLQERPLRAHARRRLHRGERRHLGPDRGVRGLSGHLGEGLASGGASSVATASCAPQYVVIAGGCDCDTGTLSKSLPSPSLDSWTCGCSSGMPASAWAICAPVTLLDAVANNSATSGRQLIGGGCDCGNGTYVMQASSPDTVPIAGSWVCNCSDGIMTTIGATVTICASVN
jgi:hypothetical protein